MATASHSSHGAILWLKRLWPLLALFAATALVLAMGWQHYLTLEALAENREVLRSAIATKMLLSLLGFVALYAVVVALSLPGGAVLTLAGGFLFGWFLGGLASIIGATIGDNRLRRGSRRKGRPILGSLPRGISARRL
jgi:uncharacterized membrane protein YdjX (TVP38/TMEM64 family)